MSLCHTGTMKDKESKKTEVFRPGRDYFSRLAKSITKKIRQKVLRRKRFLR
jgi:hypothetical protein